MVQNQVPDTNALSRLSTEDLKQKLIDLAQPHERDSLSQKRKFYESTLQPFFETLAQRNPTQNLKDQSDLVIGVWKPIWSTIPFQDVLPGRQLDQSYQIFRNDGYYANIARYALGTDLPILRNLSFNPIVYDLMLVQKYEIREEEWLIENVSIKQRLKLAASQLTLETAKNWFEQVMAAPLKEVKSSGGMNVKLPFSKKANQRASKQLQGAARAKPKLEHLYIDRDFRLVKSQRESKQRPSYTIALRADIDFCFLTNP